ncbi:unnamed protein product [Rangifer tarandus platyrhynchus]|uniref:Uncharacterized protein n=1 Tax=Rangifer tarandus platyrhynchus TaxID=3082113 RepID=A0ABN8XIG6_RANTA|nr:unnamed protein product [Rangifer tarandus platyrhynchus]
MVKAGKECKGFTPDDEAKFSTHPQPDQQEELHRRAVLIQAAYRGYGVPGVSRKSLELHAPCTDDVGGALRSTCLRAVLRPSSVGEPRVAHTLPVVHPSRRPGHRQNVVRSG